MWQAATAVKQVLSAGGLSSPVRAHRSPICLASTTAAHLPVLQREQDALPQLLHETAGPARINTRGARRTGVCTKDQWRTMWHTYI